MKLIRSPRLMVTQLEQMKQLGILGRYLPEFGRVTGQMQYDLFHIYTVDAHTLQVLRNMRRLFLGTSKETYPFASELTKKLNKLEILYIAGLYHDIGKGRGKDHSDLGTKIVKRFCNRHRLPKKDSALIEWLVQNHLKMSITSQKENLNNPKVINSFSEIVGSEERLNYLYCLTVADISATNPNLWSSWNESLLNNLYFKTLNNINLKEEFNKFSKTEAEELIISMPKTYQLKVKELWKNFYPSYFESHSPQVIKDHSLIISKRKTDSITKFFLENESFKTNSLMVYTKDRINVLGTIVGELDSQNINVLDASLYGTKDGYCLDHIIVSDQKGEPLQLNKTKIKEIELNITNSLKKEKLIPKVVKKKMPRHFLTLKKDTQIEISHDMINRWTQLDIKTADRPGLLSSICSVFAKNKASIKKARISTYGERAEDRFCISSLEETPFLKKAELDKLILELKNALDL
jgi:[protein-PII] uridylyltransferase